MIQTVESPPREFSFLTGEPESSRTTRQELLIAAIDVVDILACGADVDHVRPSIHVQTIVKPSSHMTGLSTRCNLFSPCILPAQILIPCWQHPFAALWISRTTHCHSSQELLIQDPSSSIATLISPAGPTFISRSPVQPYLAIQTGVRNPMTNSPPLYPSKV